MKSEELEKAKALLESAKKHEKKSFFKKTNWEDAGSDYEKAAKIFTYVGDIGGASFAWSHASEAYKKAKNFFFAGRAMEALALFLGEEARKGSEDSTGLLMNAVNVYKDASEQYALSDMVERQTDMLKKAAQLLCGATTTVTGFSLSTSKGLEKQRTEFVEQAICFLRKAVDVLERSSDDKPVLLTRLPEMYYAWMLIHLGNGDIKGAVEVLKQLLGIDTNDIHKKGVFERLSQPHRAEKTGLEIVVLCLSSGDEVWARQELEKLQKVSGFLGSKEEMVAQLLLVSFEERDVEQFRDAQKDQALSFINAEISRMARKLTIRCTTTHGLGLAANLDSEGSQEQEQNVMINSEEDIR